MIKLTQELAQKLGLKIRKAYVRAKVRFLFQHIALRFPPLDSNFVFNEDIFSLQPPASNSVSSDVSTQVRFYMFQVQADFKLQGKIVS